MNEVDPDYYEARCANCGRKIHGSGGAVKVWPKENPEDVVWYCKVCLPGIKNWNKQ